MGKILILANNDIGLYKFRKELIEELLKDNEVFISLPNGEFVKPLVEQGCKFIDTKIDRRGINPIIDSKLLLTYNQIISRIKPDLVITYTIKPNIYGGLICRIKSIKYAVNITGLGTAFHHDNLLKKIVIRIYKIALKSVNIVFFENEENKSIFINCGIIKRDKAYKLNGAGVNLNDYPLSPYPTENREIRFLFIGRVMKEKGIDEFLEVAKRIKQKNENVVFDVVGSKEEDYSIQLDELDKLGVINYYGHQKDVKPFIIKAHCFVLPSYHEGMANTLLECGAMGRPLITSNISGCKEAVMDGETGYLTNVKDANHLYVNIEKFINISNQEKKIMGLQSRRLIEKEFNRDKIVALTIEKLNEI